MFVLDRYSRPGFCTKCGSWLGQELGESNAELDWAGNLVHEVFEAGFQSDARRFHSEELQRGIEISILECGDTPAEFSRRSGIPKSSISEWVSGKHKPSLPALLNICFFCGNALYPMLTGSYIRQVATAPLSPLLRSVKRPRMAPQDCELAEELCPRPQILPKKKLLEVVVEEIQQIIRALIQMKQYPSARKIQLLASTKAILRTSFAKSVWKQEIKRLLMR
jgi:transcriptional regulator with XRE-family HTH domain